MNDNDYKELVLSVKQSMKILLEHERLQYITFPTKLKLQYITLLGHIFNILPRNQEYKYVLYGGNDVIGKCQDQSIIKSIVSLSYIDRLINNVLDTDNMDEIYGILSKYL